MNRVTTKLIFLLCYVVLAVLTGVALWIKPSVETDQLVWATDPNPARTEQMRRVNEQAVEKGLPPPLHIGFVPPPVRKRQYLYGGTRICVINAHSPRRYEAVGFLAYLAGPRSGRQINLSADCIPGPRKWTRTREQLSNPRYPEEHDSDLHWRDTAADIHPLMHSRFLPSATLYQCVYYHLERVGAHLCTVDEGLRALQSDMNQAIGKHIREHAYLQGAYAAARREQAEIDRRKAAASTGASGN